MSSNVSNFIQACATERNVSCHKLGPCRIVKPYNYFGSEKLQECGILPKAKSDTTCRAHNNTVFESHLRIEDGGLMSTEVRKERGRRIDQKLFHQVHGMSPERSRKPKKQLLQKSHLTTNLVPPQGNTPQRVRGLRQTPGVHHTNWLTDHDDGGFTRGRSTSRSRSVTERCSGRRHHNQTDSFTDLSPGRVVLGGCGRSGRMMARDSPRCRSPINATSTDFPLHSYSYKESSPQRPRGVSRWNSPTGANIFPVNNANNEKSGEVMGLSRRRSLSPGPRSFDIITHESPKNAKVVLQTSVRREHYGRPQTAVNICNSSPGLRGMCNDSNQVRNILAWND